MKFRFSLTTLLVLVVLISAGVGMWLWLQPRQPADVFVAYKGSDSVYWSTSWAKRFATQLDESHFDQTPTWNRSNPNPPLPADEAMRSAVDFLKAGKDLPYADFSEIPIENIQLIPFDTDKGHWYWQVNFASSWAGNENIAISIVVLMDGSVIPPEISDRLDIGWPLPNAKLVERPNDLALGDNKIASQFAKNINGDRRYAGLEVAINGTFSTLESGDPRNWTKQRELITLEDGTELLVMDSYPFLRTGPSKLTGRLVGFRNYLDEDPDWKAVQLFPGIRVEDD